jgi:tRNA U55 pseudouridine synthase TruB
MRSLPRYIVTEKQVGETPLVALERARAAHGIPTEVPLAYAGRLDPMASGTLLILVGDECKKQERYHAFDKAYTVELLLGVSSDTGDVLGITQFETDPPLLTEAACRRVLTAFEGPVELSYPHFSAKTVRGKPLHMWTLEGRLGEIEVPIKRSKIHRLVYAGLRTVSRDEIARTVHAKIELIPPVTDPRKALGEDFRRDAVRAGWNAFQAAGAHSYQILSFTCIASSGTYMRSLSERIAEALETRGLAYSIHRTRIGRYLSLPLGSGVWIRRF